MAKAAGVANPVVDCKEGRCDHSYCTLDWKPLCCEGESYGNPCMAERAAIAAPTRDHCLVDIYVPIFMIHTVVMRRSMAVNVWRNVMVS